MKLISAEELYNMPHNTPIFIWGTIMYKSRKMPDSKVSHLSTEQIKTTCKVDYNICACTNTSNIIKDEAFVFENEEEYTVYLTQIELVMSGYDTFK